MTQSFLLCHSRSFTVLLRNAVHATRSRSRFKERTNELWSYFLSSLLPKCYYFPCSLPWTRRDQCFPPSLPPQFWKSQHNTRSTGLASSSFQLSLLSSVHSRKLTLNIQRTQSIYVLSNAAAHFHAFSILAAEKRSVTCNKSSFFQVFRL